MSVNLNLNAKTWQSTITTVGAIAGGALAWAGLANATDWAAAVQKAVDFAPTAVSFIGGAISLGLTVYKAFQHTDASTLAAAGALAAGPNPVIKTIETLPTAPPAIKAVADDATVPGVQPAASAFPPSTDSRRIK